MAVDLRPLDALDELEGYRRLFYDSVFWTPYVQAACRRHGLVPDGLEPCGPVRGGIAGTCPAFIAGERWLVKFFGRLFGGGPAYRVEQEAGRLTAAQPGIPTARILASGKLDPAGEEADGRPWPWPYLIFEFIPGRSIGEQAGQLSQAGWLQVAGELGMLARRLHAISLESSRVFPNHHNAYREFLEEQMAVCVQNHREWAALPPRLVDQIERFLPPLADLVDTSRPPHLIHADLTRDHLLGRVVDGRWHTLALIDFGDAMTGSLLYELSVLHLDIFQAQKPLLAAFLDAYGVPAAQQAALPRRALATALLHRFNLFEALPPERLQAASLDELAQNLWG